MSIKFLSIPPKYLTKAITSTATTFKISNITSWKKNSLGAFINLAASDFGVRAFGCFRNSTGTILEIFEFDPATIASTDITLSKRGLAFDGDLTTQVTAYKLDWPAGTVVQLGTDVPQFFQWLKEYIDAASIAGAVPASESATGIVEEATDSEVTAGTATGGTGSKLFVTPTKLLTWIASYLPDKVQSLTVSLSSAQLLGMFATPVQIIPAPGAGKVIVIDNVLFSYTHVSIAYLAGGSMKYVYGSNTTNLVNPAVSSNNITQANSNLDYEVGIRNVSYTGPGGIAANTAVNITNDTAAFTTGNGTAKVFIKYRIITL